MELKKAELKKAELRIEESGTEKSGIEERTGVEEGKIEEISVNFQSLGIMLRRRRLVLCYVDVAWYYVTSTSLGIMLSLFNKLFNHYIRSFIIWRDISAPCNREWNDHEMAN